MPTASAAAPRPGRRVLNGLLRLLPMLAAAAMLCLAAAGVMTGEAPPASTGQAVR